MISYIPISITSLFQSSSLYVHFTREAGMNMSPVSRLKKTWAKVKTAKFDVLEVCESHVSELNGESVPVISGG